MCKWTWFTATNPNMMEPLPNSHFQKALPVAQPHPAARPVLRADQTHQMFDSRLTNKEIRLRFWGRFRILP